MRYSITIPTVYGAPAGDLDGETIPPYLVERALVATERFFATSFGGCTSYEAWGTYVNDDGVQIRERVRVVESYSSASERKVRQKIHHHCGNLVKFLMQECVMYTVGVVAEFVTDEELREEQCKDYDSGMWPDGPPRLDPHPLVRGRG